MSEHTKRRFHDPCHPRRTAIHAAHLPSRMFPGTFEVESTQHKGTCGFFLSMAWPTAMRANLSGARGGFKGRF